MKFGYRIGVAWLAAASLAGAADWRDEDHPRHGNREERSIDESRPAAADGRVSIENPVGSVEVVGWDKAEVHVTGTLGRGVEDFTFDGGGQRTRIEVETSHPSGHRGRSTLRIQVPAGSDVDVESFAGDVRVEGVKGRVSAETVNGSVEVAGRPREVEVQAVNGSIRIAGAAGRIEAQAVNGDLTIRGGREIEAGTVNGRLEVEGGPYSRAALQSVAGDVSFAGELTPDARLDVETVSGAVELSLPEAFGAAFTLSTFSGEIESELGPAIQRERGIMPGSNVSFSTGAGAGRVEVSTMSGEITLRKGRKK